MHFEYSLNTANEFIESGLAYDLDFVVQLTL